MALRNLARNIAQDGPSNMDRTSSAKWFPLAAAVLAACWQWPAATAQLVVEHGQNADFVKLHSWEPGAPVVTLV